MNTTIRLDQRPCVLSDINNVRSLSPKLISTLAVLNKFTFNLEIR